MSTEAKRGATFLVPAVPIAEPRKRIRVRGTFAQAYTPTDSPVNAFKATVAMAAREACNWPPIEGPVYLQLECVFPRPKQMVWKTKPMPRVRHFKKPDRDNVEKAVMDALKGLLWIDDAQVCDGPVTKWIAAGDETAHVRVCVLEL